MAAASMSSIVSGAEAAVVRGTKLQHPAGLCSFLTTSRNSAVWGRSIKIQVQAPAFLTAKNASVRPNVVIEGAARQISGKCFVLPDNIDTDQIIPAEYLTLVPSKPNEYEKLGSYAMAGLPPQHGRFIEQGKMKTDYPVIIAGANFGCGSSREHAPVALGASGVKAIVAQSYARIFFRNSVATGEIYPVESEARICDEFHTGDDVTVDMERDLVVNNTTGKQYALKPLGDAAPVIDAGGIFAYARSTGMIGSPAV